MHKIGLCTLISCSNCFRTDHRSGYRTQWRTESAKRRCSKHEWLFRTSGGWLHLRDGVWGSRSQGSTTIICLGLHQQVPRKKSLSFKHFL